MPVNKPHLEFHRIDMSTGWSTPPGYPAGIEQKILAGDLDEERHSGSRTACCGLRREYSRPHPSSMNIGKRFI